VGLLETVVPGEALPDSAFAHREALLGAGPQATLVVQGEPAHVLVGIASGQGNGGEMEWARACPGGHEASAVRGHPEGAFAIQHQAEDPLAPHQSRSGPEALHAARSGIHPQHLDGQACQIEQAIGAFLDAANGVGGGSGKRLEARGMGPGDALFRAHPELA